MRVVEKSPCFVTSCLKKSGSASVLVIRISFWSAVSIHGTILKRKQQCKQADTLYTAGKQWRLSVTPTTDISSSGLLRNPTTTKFHLQSWCLSLENYFENFLTLPVFVN